MRLLLLQDVRKLGHLGDVVEVSPGYARNYLLPQRLATEPTEENIKAIEDRRRAATAERAMRTKRFAELVEQLQGVEITIEKAANPEGTLYGSVTEKDIAGALNAQGFPVTAEHVMLQGHIRTLDSRMVTLEFTEDITTEIKLWVVREGGAAEHGDDADEASGEPDESAAAAEPS
jgi:large subunit ribosomal protein L9